jgi:LPS O-antigen subunit length determinant protein (WzzB/FepE family)
MGEIDFTPYQYQRPSSLPLNKDGLGKSLIIVLATLFSLIIAAGSVLVRSAITLRSGTEEMYVRISHQKRLLPC